MLRDQIEEVNKAEENWRKFLYANLLLLVASMASGLGYWFYYVG
jgi:hypothetical protein